jgi:hypothetical protein
MLADGLGLHEFSRETISHLMHWLGAGGILEEGWHSIPFTQFVKKLQLLADGKLVMSGSSNGRGKPPPPPQQQQQQRRQRQAGSTALPSINARGGRDSRKKRQDRPGKKHGPLHGRRSAPPVL